MSLCDVTTCNLYRTLALPGQLLTHACSDSSTCTFFSISLVLWGSYNLKPSMISLFCLAVYTALLWYNCFFVQKICRYLSSVCRAERNSLYFTHLRSLMCVIWGSLAVTLRKLFDMIPYVLVGGCQFFRGNFCFHFLGSRWK
jgi:hypothetical protein